MCIRDSPEAEARSGLGTYIILDHIRRSAERELPYVYLGYWVAGSDRMQYKVRFRPLERLTSAGWERIGDEEHDRLIAAAIVPRSGGLRVGLPGKDKLPAGYRLAV